VTSIFVLTSVVMAAPGTAPIHTLRSILLRLGQDGVLTRLHSRLPRALQNTVGGDVMELAIPSQLGDSSSSSYALFRENITRRLFGSDVLLQLRLKLAITDFCWVRTFLLSPSQSCFPSSLSPYKLAKLN
jgi:general transcription factor 3C polypeptide 4